MALAFAPTFALARGVAQDRELSTISVSGTRSPLDPNLPASTFSLTREDFDQQNVVNTQDALQYAPDTPVRRLKMSDRNGGIGTRSSGVGIPARTLVYVDGMLISNFLAQHQVPRWNTVSPSEVVRVDVLYGPYSAIYPGNSIGTTVAITTRQPTQLEASGRILVYGQKQSNYGIEQDFNGNSQSAWVGNRWGNLSATVALEKTKAVGQGTGYALASLAQTNTGGTPVSGAIADRDVNGNPRTIFGVTGIENSDQTLAKIRLNYDFTSELSADMTYVRWQNDYTASAQTNLRDSSGNEVWSGKVLIGGASYTLPVMGPKTGKDEHQQIGLRLRTRAKKGWNYSVQASDYRIATEQARTANFSTNLAAGAVAGSETVGDGTGWRTFEIQSTYTPEQPDGHALALGYHRNEYRLKSQTFNLTNWHTSASRTGESASNFGKTRIQALYAQDAWRFVPTWTLTAGLRAEQFEAFDGSQYAAGAGPTLQYAARRINATSPKLSLAHDLNDTWLVRASAGRGIRFPTVAELFQGVKTGTALVTNDPNLRPEKNDAKELALLHETGASSLRLSLFEDNIKDAIFKQTVAAGAGTASVYMNVDKVRTRGLEIAYSQKDILPGFDLTASAAFLNSRILKNAVTPESVGKRWPGLPDFRASLLASYRSGSWLTSLGIRHENRRFSTLTNSDVFFDTYGTNGAYTVADARISYNLARWGSIAVGINNLTDIQYYEFHPYAGRTLFTEINVSY